MLSSLLHETGQGGWVGQWCHLLKTLSRAVLPPPFSLWQSQPFPSVIKAPFFFPTARLSHSYFAQSTWIVCQLQTAFVFREVKTISSFNTLNVIITLVRLMQFWTSQIEHLFGVYSFTAMLTGNQHIKGVTQNKHCGGLFWYYIWKYNVQGGVKPFRN